MLHTQHVVHSGLKRRPVGVELQGDKIVAAGGVCVVGAWVSNSGGPGCPGCAFLNIGQYLVSRRRGRLERTKSLFWFTGWKLYENSGLGIVFVPLGKMRSIVGLCTLQGREPSPDGGTAAQSQYGILKVARALLYRSLSSPSENSETACCALRCKTSWHTFSEGIEGNWRAY
jgi:hypothetical protein